MVRSRVIVVVMAVALVAAGCSSDERTTPVIDLPVPPTPVFMTSGLAGWGDAVVATLCVDVAMEGDFESGEDGLPDVYVPRVMEGFGVEVVEAGCDATLSVEMAARMIPADYTGAGRCYSGFDGTATATLSMPGYPDVIGSYEYHKDPPGSVLDSACRKEATVSESRWDGMIAHVLNGDRGGVLGDLFGESLLLALQVSVAGGGGFVGDEYLDSTDMPISDSAVALLDVVLFDDDRGARYRAAMFARDLADDVVPRDRRLLDPVVPYLIWALADEDQWDLDNVGSIHPGDYSDGLTSVRRMLGDALREITGEDFDFRADHWWEWWQENQA